MELVNIKAPANFKHCCNPGDLIAMLASMKSYKEKTGRKVVVCQHLNFRPHYYDGATHGTVDKDGNLVCMNKEIFDLVKPLVENQDYIERMEELSDQKIFVDLDVIREKVFVNLPQGMIQTWSFYAYPDLNWDLSKDWVSLPEKDTPIISWIKDKVILNFTERYRNGNINYYFLRKYKDKLIFSGTKKEHLLFTNSWGIDIPYLEVKDFLELAYAIKNCKFLLCNQSFQWNLSFSMHTPHILEMCRYAANCMPFTYDGSVGFYHQEGLEHYFYEMIG